MQNEPFTSVRRDSDVILVDAHDPVFASSSIGMLFGIERVIIARQTQNDFDQITDMVGQVGGSLLLGGEVFAVSVDGTSKGFLPRDVEMAATARIIESKSSSGVQPGTPERHDKLLYTHMTPKHAYVSIFEDGGMGGLPTGIQGRAVCCVFDELSAVSCYETMRMGFEVQPIVCYKKKSDITGLARTVDKILSHILAENLSLTFCHVNPESAGYEHMAASATRIMVQKASGYGATHVGLPVSRMAFPGDMTDRLAGEVAAAGLVPVGVLGDHAAIQKTLARLNLKSVHARRTLARRHQNDAKASAAESCHTIQVRAGPNSLHEMLDSLHQILEF